MLKTEEQERLNKKKQKELADQKELERAAKAVAEAEEKKAKDKADKEGKTARQKAEQAKIEEKQKALKTQEVERK